MTRRKKRDRKKPGRNDPCPCGILEKYKRCCGAERSAREEGSFRTEEADYRPTFVFDHDDSSEYPSIESCADVRKYLDAVADSHAVLSFQREQALRDVLRACQSVYVVGSYQAGMAGFLHGFYDPMRSLQDALKYLVYKAYRLCPERGNGAIESMPYRQRTAGDALACFLAFSRVHDSVVSAESGFFNCGVDSVNRHVHFDWVNDEIRSVQTLYSLSREDEAADANRARLAKKGGRGFIEMNRLLMSSLRTDGEAFSYEIPEGGVAAYLQYDSETPGMDQDVPGDWSVGPYTVDEHRGVWRVLRSFSIIHSFVLMNLVASRRRSPPPVGAELILDPETVIAECERATGVRASATEAILSDLTYDPDVRWTDVAYQPLFGSGDGKLLSCGVLLEGSGFERNLLALLPRLPHRRSGAEELKRHREEVMIRELTDIATDVGLNVRPRLKLYRDGGRGLLTDIDLLIWDARGDYALAVSLKWFVGPDSMQEVINHDAQFREALPIAVTAAEFLHDHAAEYSSRASLVPPLGIDSRVCPVIVARMDTPSPLVDTSGCPVVTQRYFARVIRETNGDLAEALSRFPEALGEVKAAVDVKRGHGTVPFGSYKFFIPNAAVTWQEQ